MHAFRLGCLVVLLTALSVPASADDQPEAGKSEGGKTEGSKTDASKADTSRAADDATLLRTQLTEMRTLLQNIGSRIESIETKLGTLGDKVSADHTGIENLMANKKAFPTAVSAHPSEGAGSRPSTPTSLNDPEAGFESDEAVQSFRKGSILLGAMKYPEAVLAFSAFVETYPDHPLAGSAQFYVGESYFRQKEYRLALREFERVLTSYDRSPHIADTLKEMSETEDHLKLTERAARHRQLLTSLFPQSPAANLNTSPAVPPIPLDAPPTAPLTTEKPAP